MSWLHGLGTYLAVKERQEKVKDLVITDICPFSLGISAYDSDFDKISFQRSLISYLSFPTSCKQILLRPVGDRNNVVL